MNESKIKYNFSKSSKIILIVLLILLVISIIIGASYAYYIITVSQTKQNVVTSSCINMSLTNEKNAIKLEKQFPILDSEGKKLTPYSFTITNTCDLFLSYKVNLEMLEGTTLNSKYVKVMVNNEATQNLANVPKNDTTYLSTSVESRTLAQGSLSNGDSVDYTLRIWMDEDTPLVDDAMNKSLLSKVIVTAEPSSYKPTDYVSTLHDAILVNEYQVKTTDNAISKITAKETPDFN